MYDLGGLDIGEKFEPEEGDVEPTIGERAFPPCIFKIQIIRKELKNHESVMWLDGDALLQKEITEPPKDNEVVLTERREKHNNPLAGRINAGVMFFNNTPDEFLDVWEKKARQMRTDQGALNNMLDNWDIEFVPCDLYNNFYFDGTEQDAYVVHYKGGAKERIL